MFDLVNDIAGYTERYYEETLDKIDHDGLVMKYRNAKNSCESSKDIENHPLLGDLYPHCLLVLEGIQSFYEMP